MVLLLEFGVFPPNFAGIHGPFKAFAHGKLTSIQECR